MIQKNILKNIIVDNHKEIENHKVINRNISFEKHGNYVLVGARRAGKSFLLYQHIQSLLANGLTWDEMLYLNFEDERLIDMTTEDLNTILEVHYSMSAKKPILFLDEIQNILGWDKFARRLADNKYQVFITGSNAKMLSKDVATTLGGRYIIKEIFPYNFAEYLSANEIKLQSKWKDSTTDRATVQRFLQSYFMGGGFPESACMAAKKDYLMGVYQKIYLNDIAMRNNIENKFALRLMFKKLAESVKQPISFSRLTNTLKSVGVKVSTNTIINYIDYSTDAYLIFPIKNIVDKLIDRESNKKYYFIDNGILNLLTIENLSSLMENIVAIDLLRQFGTDENVFFYNKNIEVDFYLPDIEWAIQVCLSLYNSDDKNTFARETSALAKLSKFFNCSRYIIITFDEEDTITIDNITIEVIPLWKWLLRRNK